jgi:hypothetical protein
MSAWLVERPVDFAVHNRTRGEIMIVQPVESDSPTPNMEVVMAKKAKKAKAAKKTKRRKKR